MHFEGSGLGKFHISGVPTNDTNLSSIGAGADFTCLFRYALFLSIIYYKIIYSFIYLELIRDFF